MGEASFKPGFAFSSDYSTETKEAKLAKSGLELELLPRLERVTVFQGFSEKFAPRLDSSLAVSHP